MMAVATTTTTTTMPSVSIGTSVVEFLDDGQSTTCDTAAAQASSGPCTTPTSMPSLLTPHGLDRPKRILLHGPSKSGRTSMAMDLAYSMATTAPCRCRQPLQQHVCRCIAATLFVPMHQQRNDDVSCDGDQNNDSSLKFPLQCHKVHHPGEQEIQVDFESRLRQHYLDTSTTTTEEQASSSLPDWDKNVLGRIEVRHVSNLRQVLQYLLSIQGRPSHEQPSGAIIIDDLDILATTYPSLPSTMMHTLAILIDTSNAVGRLHGGIPPTILATTKMQISTTPWISTTVSLHPTSHSEPPSCWRHLLLRDTTIVSHWKAEISELWKNHHPSMAASSIVDYSFTKSLVDGGSRFQIHWMERDATNHKKPQN